MKKNVLLFVSVLVLGLTSCSKDDTQEPASIVGTWDQFQFVEVIDGEEVVEDYIPSCSGNPTHYIFNNNGEGFANSYYSPNCELESVPLSWSKSGQNLMISAGDELVNTQITLLNETTLKLVYGQEGSETLTVIYRRR